MNQRVGTKVTHLDAISHGVELCDPIQRDNRHGGNVAPPRCRGFWHRARCIELGVIGLNAKALTIIFWHEKYISRTVPGKMQPLFEPSTMENIFCMYFNCKGIKHKT